MDITILGSGGNSQIPMPTCECSVCQEARKKGIPYERSGNHLFIHDENILIDCPENTWNTLDRENITQVDTIILTHYHGDHTLGLRVLQAIGGEQPPVETFTGEDLPNIVMNKSTYEHCIKAYGFFEQLVENWGNLTVLEDGEKLSLGSITMTNIESKMSKDGQEGHISSYLFEKDGKKVLVSSDETKYLDLSKIPSLDLWIRETGYFMEDPEGNPLVTEKAVETTIKDEIKFEESIQQIRSIEPEKVVLTEIEELFRHGHEDLKQLEQEYTGLNLKFAYDGMKLEV